MVLRVDGNIRVATIIVNIRFLKGKSSLTRLYAPIDETNIVSYLSLKNVVAIGGSFMMKGDIKENSKRVLNLINKGE